jgi:hypothetical protein
MDVISRKYFINHDTKDRGLSSLIPLLQKNMLLNIIFFIIIISDIDQERLSESVPWSTFR